MTTCRFYLAIPFVLLVVSLPMGILGDQIHYLHVHRGWYSAVLVTAIVGYALSCLIVVGFAQTKGHDRECVESLLIGVPLLFLFLHSFYHYTNGIYDSSPSEDVRAVVEGKSRYHGRADHRRNVYVNVEGFDGVQVLSVRRDIAASLKAGDHLVLRMHQGRWGKAWVEGEPSRP